MLFGTPVFILGFLPLALGGFFVAGCLGPRAAMAWLLAAGCVFYGWDRPALVGLLLASILGNWLIGSRAAALVGAGRERTARVWVAAGVVGDLALLGWFKYAGFFAANVAAIGGFDVAVEARALPLGISFFTFQQIMFLVDCGRPGATRSGLLPYASFISFFPHLIAGPLVQPTEIIPQLTRSDIVRPDAENLTTGLTIFLLGLGKKLVLADTFAAFADPGFNAAARGASLSFFEAWYATLAYSLQIYFDFSGYSDMAIGLARMFNIRFPQNFDSPYKAGNISDFWQRWHISLGRFLRGHVYIPLGGNRRGALLHARNLLTTMLLGGLWHGAGWNFLLWGGLHGVAMVMHRIFRRLAPPAPERLLPTARFFGHALTLAFVIAAWVPFRADGMTAAWRVWHGMLGLDGIALPDALLAIAPPLARIADPVPVLRYLGDARTLSFPEVTACLAIGWLIVLAAPNVHALSTVRRRFALGGSFAFTVQALFFAPSVQPFLYFQF